MSEYYSTSEAAKRFGVTKFTILRWIKAGHLKATRGGPEPRSPWRIARSAIEDLERRLEKSH